MFTRVLDLAVLLLLGVAIVMPRPDVNVRPALAVDAADRDRVAELQTRLLQTPDDADAALALADIFLDAQHADWALSTLATPLDAHPRDHRLLSRRSLALAQHYEPHPAWEAAKKALALCEKGSAAPCGEGEHDRLELLVSTLDRIKHLDVRANPNATKERLLMALRPAYIPKKPSKSPVKPGNKPGASAPAPKSGATP
jgi:hypothetical protein